jgi:hypothetical protein
MTVKSSSLGSQKHELPLEPTAKILFRVRAAHPSPAAPLAEATVRSPLAL